MDLKSIPTRDRDFARTGESFRNVFPVIRILMGTQPKEYAMPRGKERQIVYVVTFDAQGRRVVKAVPTSDVRIVVKSCA